MENGVFFNFNIAYWLQALINSAFLHAPYGYSDQKQKVCRRISADFLFCAFHYSLFVRLATQAVFLSSLNKSPNNTLPGKGATKWN